MHSSEIAKATFSTRKFREGYAMPEVDDYLREIRQTLESWEAGRPGALTAGAVLESRFTPTKFRTGYDQDEVDNFLDRVSATMRDFESGTRP